MLKRKGKKKSHSNFLLFKTFGFHLLAMMYADFIKKCDAIGQHMHWLKNCFFNLVILIILCTFNNPCIDLCRKVLRRDSKYI